MNLVFHIAGLSWVLVSLATLGFGLPVAAVFVAGAASFLSLLIIGRKRLPLWMASAAAAVCFCALSLLFHGGQARIRTEYTGALQTVRGLVTDQIFSDRSVETILRLTGDNPDGLENARLRVHSRPGVEESVGDVVEYTVRLQSSPALWSKGFDFEAFATERRVVGQGTHRVWTLRQAMASRLRRLLPNGEGDLLSGVLLGRTEKIPQTVREDYGKAGISHVLAVSGLHLSIMLALFGVLLQRRLFSRTQRILAEIGLALAFAALTGFPPSMARAVSMLVLSRAALLLGRDADALNSLGFSIICILLWNPYAVFSLSLQLSYLSTMGICAFSEPMSNWFSRAFFHRDWFALSEYRPKTAAVLSALCVPLSAQVLTTPLICWQFGRVSLISPITNLLIAFPLTIMLFLGMVCSLLGFAPILTPFCRLAALGAGHLARLITRLAHVCASLPGASFAIQNDSVIIWMAAVILLLILLWYLRCTGWQALWAVEWSVCALAAALCAHLVFWGHPLTVCVPNYGDTVLLLYGNQAVLLGAPKGESETDRLLALMSDGHVTSLSLLIPQERAHLESAAAQRLINAYKPEQILPLDEYTEITADLFGGAAVTRRGDMLEIKAGISIVKGFAMEPAAANVLINGSNEIITHLRLCQNSRYYGCTRIFLSMPEGVQEDAT